MALTVTLKKIEKQKQVTNGYKDCANSMTDPELQMMCLSAIFNDDYFWLK